MNLITDAELKKANIQLERALNTIGEQITTRVTNQLNQKLKQDLMKMKAELLGSFQVVAYNTFQEFFYREYGNNYDVNSLNLSLHFSVDDNLHPHLSYDIHDFTIKSDFSRDARTFNQNVEVEGSFGSLMEVDELDAMDEMEFYGLSFDNMNPYDYATEEMTPPDDYKVFRPRKLVSNPKEVYQKAEIATLNRFAIEYERKIKPLFIKKYGIKL